MVSIADHFLTRVVRMWTSILVFAALMRTISQCPIQVKKTPPNPKKWGSPPPPAVSEVGQKNDERIDATTNNWKDKTFFYKALVPGQLIYSPAIYWWTRQLFLFSTVLSNFRRISLRTYRTEHYKNLWMIINSSNNLLKTRNIQPMLSLEGFHDT